MFAQRRAGPSSEGRIVLAVKVLEGLSGGIEPGSNVSIEQLGLPASGAGGALLVFWKST
jgi:hypothetical protein